MAQEKRTGKPPPVKNDPSSADKDNIRVVSIFVGNKTASEAFYNAAVKKILYEKQDGS